MTEAEKWSCEICTYQNFPASSKCTLCNAKRQHVISDFQNEEQDIYKMAATMGHNKEISSNALICSTSSRSEPSNKWACPACTYLNWTRSTKCSQCHTPKKNTSPGSSSPKQPGKSRHRRETTTTTHSGEIIKSGKVTPSTELIPVSPKAAKAASNNDINKTLTKYAKGKWVCKACTYENWPKAAKCVICGTNRGRASPEIITSSSTLLSPTGSHSNKTSSTAMSLGASAQADKQSSECNEDTSDYNNLAMEKKLKHIRKCMREKDWLWLNACWGVVTGDLGAVESFIASGGDPARQLTLEEVSLLNRSSAFEVGYTIVHLAIRFQRDDMLAVLLTSTESAAKGLKRLPSHVSPDIAAEIRRETSSIFRQRKVGKGEFPCQFLSDCVTFALPKGVLDLPEGVQTDLFNELLDNDVQKELEDELVINWSVELTDRLGSRQYALWNRTAGDCLLDSVMQATWGVFDSDNTLRHALSESINDGAMMFYPRWKEYESMHAEMLQFTLDETQWQNDWAELLKLASQPGASLEQTHIFALAHILRRPIIVYGVKYVKSFRGETLGFARFQGVYLPLLWEKDFCWKSPIALAYTRGHFSALVPMEMDTDVTLGAGAHIESNDDEQPSYLPLVDFEGKLLPVPFLTGSEIGREEIILHEWLDCVVSKGGCMVALQKIGKQPLLVKQMVEEWLQHYRQSSHSSIPTNTHSTLNSQTFSSDGESDQE